MLQQNLLMRAQAHRTDEAVSCPDDFIEQEHRFSDKTKMSLK